MSAVLQAREPDARYLAIREPVLLEHFDLLATAPGGVARLRELILTLAVRGKLVPQDSGDEPASRLLERIRAEKARLVKEGRIRKEKPLAGIGEEEKPSVLPAGWEWASLAEIGLISPRNDTPDDVIASFVQMSSIPITFSTPHSAEDRCWVEIKTGFTHFAEGDVGVAKITPCFENGKSTVFRNLTNGIGAGTTELHVVRPLGGLNPEFVLLFLKTPDFLRKGEAVMTGSAGQKRLPRSYFETKPFPLPPLPEQSRIVARVEELMQLCDALEAQGRLEAEHHARLTGALFDALAASESAHALAENWQRVAAHFDLLLDRPEAVDALEQTILQLAVRGLLVPQDPTDEPASVLLQKIRAEKDRLIAAGKIKRDKPVPPIAEEEMPFELPEGWEWARLGALSTLENGDRGANYPSKTDFIAEGVAFINAGHLVDGFVDYSEMNFISPARFHLLRSGKIQNRDILYCLRGSLGKLALVVGDTPGAIASSLVIIRITAGFDHSYAMQYLLSPLARQLIRRFDNGTAQPNLGANDLAKFVVPLPPLAEQSRIVDRVTELRSLYAALRQRLAAARQTQSRLAEALADSVSA